MSSMIEEADAKRQCRCTFFVVERDTSGRGQTSRRSQGCSWRHFGRSGIQVGIMNLWCVQWTGGMWCQGVASSVPVTAGIVPADVERTMPISTVPASSGRVAACTRPRPPWRAEPRDESQARGRFAVLSGDDDDARQGVTDDAMEVFDMTRDDSHGEDTPQAGPADVPSTMVATPKLHWDNLKCSTSWESASQAQVVVFPSVTVGLTRCEGVRVESLRLPVKMNSQRATVWSRCHQCSRIWWIWHPKHRNTLQNMVCMVPRRDLPKPGMRDVVSALLSSWKLRTGVPWGLHSRKWWKVENSIAVHGLEVVFFFLSWLLLFCPPRGGRVPKKEDRFRLFHSGQWALFHAGKASLDRSPDSG